jgi:hypothetical protein
MSLLRSSPSLAAISDYHSAEQKDDCRPSEGRRRVVELDVKFHFLLFSLSCAYRALRDDLW